ncbi:Glutathione S-transferase domain-containing protein [Acidithiobacillus ferrivorans SS3]|uniref:Glutathione S-transferase N-terminal domain-containing protein n=2 Tax=Acidithiobacillus ferrivorans TaxID=160808 RepID=A0A1E7XWT8_9PROT|nr:glutathione S-transferase N-terminal domain-containing protein [Acidithiobacillus ferrivorans]AEM48941.1 Glutathione S-transferase domain-containing protein [Acidithiobacillus ferrivorans SS3]MBU2766163.1 glutathione S-transferase [Acidithiobacillus ferrivorans]MBU2850224.1 glutathione S-transferase [Acidithiobacillus ferrivorans]OFA17575.1 glutathione S-transferase [Acidithiobacillus ferrivorans]QQD72538.1 glutathione S-transferase N-terminal domain-containing protein [Acidithiobacillus fe
MRLYATQTSPYARKVRIALLEKNIPCALEWVDLRATDHGALEHNPLGKIPVLVRDDGAAVYDSAVIIQYLEILRPEPAIIPHDPEARIAALRIEALASGIMDSTVAWVLEQRHSNDCQDLDMLQRARGKIVAALAVLQEETCGWKDVAAAPVLNLAQIATIAAVGYVDLRAPDFLLQFPELTTWMHALRQRPGISATVPQ